MEIFGSSFTEHQVIAALKEIFTTDAAHISVGIGDDAAVVTGGAKQILTTDMAVEGVHFRTEWASAFEIGRKATAANIADVLAMSGTTDYLLVAVALTGKESMDWVTELARGIRFEADLAGAYVVGGDISRSEKVIISISAIGSVIQPILRSGAKAGDQIYLSSLTGWSAAGLEILKSNSNVSGKFAEKALQEFKSPTIDYQFDASKASALCDISDALVIQGAQLAESSKVAFSFNLSKIENSSEFAELSELANLLGVDVWHWIFAGGEDHVLLATGKDLAGTLIGEVTQGQGLTNLPAGVGKGAWQHF